MLNLLQQHVDIGRGSVHVSEDFRLLSPCWFVNFLFPFFLNSVRCTYHCLKNKPTFQAFEKYNSRQIALLLVGLDNAGKTTAAYGLCGKLTDPVLPTVGFSSVNVKYKGHLITLYDVGGGPQIRGIWNQYYGIVHGLIFFIDASDAQRLNECKEVFSNMMWNDKVFGKPILICINKQDKESTMHEFDITEQMNVERLVNLRQCPTKVEVCSALPVQTNNCCQMGGIDPSLMEGFRWLISYILTHFEFLNDQVLNYEKQQTEAAETKRNEWKLRQKNMTTLLSDENSLEKDSFTDPFKPISSLLKETNGIANSTSNHVNEELLSAGNANGKSEVVRKSTNAFIIPVEINNVESPVDRLNKSTCKDIDLNDDDDCRSYLNTFRNLPSANLSKSTSNDKNAVQHANENISSQEIPKPSLKANSGKRNSGKSLFTLRRFNKVTPTPNNTIELENQTELQDLSMKCGDRDRGDENVSEIISTQRPRNPTLSCINVPSEVAQVTSSSGVSKIPLEVLKSNRGNHFSAFNQVTFPSTECIIADSDDDDVVI